jgi:hypothetical protein
MDAQPGGMRAVREHPDHQAEHGIAVYAIPRQAVVRQPQYSLVLHTTLSAARSRWLMHVRTSARPIAMSGQGLLAPAMEWRSWS